MGLGVVAVVFKSQLMLSFYILLMSLLFVVHFSVSAAVLVASEDQEFDVCQAGWCRMDAAQQSVIQKHFGCATFDGIFNTSAGATCNYATNASQVPASCLPLGEC